MSSQGQVTKRDGLFTGLRFRDLQIIGATWLRFAFRSGGGVFSLFLVVIFGLMLPTMILSPVEALLKREGMTNANTGAMIKFIAEGDTASGLLEFVIDGSEEEKSRISNHLLKERPALLSLALLIMMYIVPFSACAAAFNQTAGDIGTRGLRFLLSRTERPNIFLGRFISAFFFVSVSLVLIVVLLTLYIHFKLDLYPLGELVAWSSWGVLMFIVFALPYVALASWVSCCMRTPFSALAMTYLAALGPPLFLLIVGAMMKGAGMDLDWLPKLMPWGWKFQLLSGDMGSQLKGAGAMAGFAVLFVLVGLMTFRKRDL